jgi:hypothetical protein
MSEFDSTMFQNSRQFRNSPITNPPPKYRWNAAADWLWRTDGAGKVANLYARSRVGTSHTKCAALCLNLALSKPAENAGAKLKANMWEYKNSNRLEEVGCCKKSSNVPRIQPANHGVNNFTIA